jgi:hypothetical protein
VEETPYTIIETENPLKHLPPLDLSKEPIAAAHAAMIDELSRLRCPSISVNPLPDEFGAVADYVVAVTRIADRWLKLVGLEVRANSLEPVEMKDFTDQFFGVVDGNATFWLDRSAESLREDHEECERQNITPASNKSFGDQLFADMARLNRLLYGGKL